ncbi:MAG: ABC transporter permease [Rhodobacteraceae bacterium]|nr:ABC transporter permease [Paracoccaceae bacterium]
MSHWRRHPLQLTTLLAGLALATGLWSAVQAINAEARASYNEAALQLGGVPLPELRAANGTIALETYVALRRAGWQLSPVLEGRVQLGNTWVSVMGVDPLSHPGLPAMRPTDGAPLTTFTQMFAHRDTIADIGTQAQDTRAQELPLTSSTQVPLGMVLGDIALAERLLDQPGRISRLLILPQQPLGLKTRQPLSVLAPDLIRSIPDRGADTARLTDSFHLNLTAFGLLAFAVGLFIVHGTVGLAFEQRRPMLRTLRALGVPLRSLSLLLLGELILLAIVAGGIGLILGYLVASALIGDVAATLRGLYGAPVEGSLTLRPIWFVSGLGMAVAGALLASAQALWRLHSMPLLAAPGVLAWGQHSARSDRGMALAGLGLMGAGGLAVLIFDGLVPGFALLGGLMLGAALMLPGALGLALRFGQSRTRGPLAYWLWGDMRAGLPGLSLALMALLLALATNVGVSTMVSSFRLTFTGWLDQRLSAQIYVSTINDAQGDELRAFLAGRVDAILPIRYGEVRIDGQDMRVYGIVDHASYRDNWPLLDGAPDVWDQVAKGKGALINELLARRNDLWPGEPGENDAQLQLGGGWVMPVVGVYSDYGNPAGQIIVSLDSLLAHAGPLPNRQFGLQLDPADTHALVRDLNGAFDPPLAGVLDQSSLKAHSLEIFDKTFVVTGALNVLTLGVAGFAILTSLLTLWSMRLPQLAPVWALGLTRARLARLEVVRSVALAGMTALLALPLGLVLAWVLLAVINVEAFGWRLPMYLFPWDWLVLLGLTLVAAAAAAALPARRLANAPPAELLRVFANER